MYLLTCTRASTNVRAAHLHPLVTRVHPSPGPVSLFHRKSLAALRAEADSGVLRRSLGPVQLTALGIGSIIGTGIFVLSGTAASGHAGPGLWISMVFAAIGCAFAGLCYAELASM